MELQKSLKIRWLEDGGAAASGGGVHPLVAEEFATLSFGRRSCSSGSRSSSVAFPVIGFSCWALVPFAFAFCSLNVSFDRRQFR